MYSDIVSGNTFTAGAFAIVDGDVDSFGAADLGANIQFNNNMICQTALTLGANKPFKGDIYAGAADTLGDQSHINGNIFCCKTFIGVGPDVTSQVLVLPFSLSVPSSNGSAVFADINKSFLYLNSLPNATDLESSISNNVLLPGIYFQVAPWSFKEGTNLTFYGNSTDKSIIQL